MALLSAGGICKSFGSNSILENVSFEIQANDRVGLIGRNGCGKTTLFKILTGELAPDRGEVSVAGRAGLGYMEQHVCRDPDRRALDEVLTVFAPLMRMERELEELSRRLQAKPENMDALIAKQAELTERYDAGGGLTFRSRTKAALAGLGFSESEFSMPVGFLSGGQRAKLQLAKLLLCGARLLLLDEPTNHLDIAAVEWLEEFLRGFSGAYIVISHDRYFLDRVTGRTFELKNARLKIYPGKYSAYLSLRDEQALSAERKYENTQREIRRLNGVVEQQRRWNQERNYKTAESKLKVIRRLEGTLEKPEKEEKALRFRFETARRGGNDVLKVENLALRFGEKELFRNVNMEIHRGEHVFLLGPNGCGKTSLLKTLLGENRPCAGSFRFGAGISVGYYDQLQTGLQPGKTVLDEIWDRYPKLSQTEVRSALAVFLFQGDDVFKPVSALSGGERARVLLLRLMLSRDNFLMLDEPTNHLDISSCEALENALRSYDGTLLVVSHDRYLINKLADRIYTLSPSGASVFDGDYDGYAEALKNRRQSAPKKAPSAEKSAYLRRRRKTAALRKKKAEMSRLEKQIDQSELQIRRLEALLATPEKACDYEAAMKLTAQISGLKKENEARFQRWSSLAQESGE
jgi:ATP-binding cassette subfamily F protein 3